MVIFKQIHYICKKEDAVFKGELPRQFGHKK